MHLFLKLKVTKRLYLPKHANCWTMKILSIIQLLHL